MSLAILAKLGMIKIPPQAWDALIPHGPKVSQVFVEFMAAGLVRDIARRVSDKSLGKNLIEVSRDMAKSSMGGLISSWEDGDICPPWWPWPWPGPRPNWEEIFDPMDGKFGPFAPFAVPGIEQLVLADALVSISQVTTNVEHSKMLFNSAIGIAKTFGSLTDDIAKVGLQTRKLG
jgi:hypothetical protein